MFRNAVIVSLVLLTPGLAAAIPLPEEAFIRPVMSLEGTTWAGDGAVAPTVYFFEKEGVLSYSYNGNHYRNGTWKQDGSALYFECNNKFYEFKGQVAGEEITGNSWNVNGGKWTLRIKLQTGGMK
ncbi:MAG: hypothetical protein JNM56_40520 [Planctomycetia bacterium]|nr:hypothetical protein [Planctomycetia bacterium]